MALVAISPNDPQSIRLDELGYTDVSDSLEEMKIRAKDKAFNFPYLYDGEDQKVSRAYGPATTPHVFIFDRQRKLRFAGRIDNSDKPRGSHLARDARRHRGPAGRQARRRGKDQDLRLLDQMVRQTRVGEEVAGDLGQGRGSARDDRRKGHQGAGRKTTARTCG